MAATRLMTSTGWRRGEVRGLRWSEIDLPRPTGFGGCILASSNLRRDQILPT